MTVAGRCDGMSGNNSGWQNDHPGSIMVEGHPNEIDLRHPDTPADPQGPPNRPILYMCWFSPQWRYKLVRRSTLRLLATTFVLVVKPARERLSQRRGPLPKLLWTDLLLLLLFIVFYYFYYDIVLLGRVALVRGVAGYSHQTFPWTICRSVGRSVCPYVRRSDQCIVEKRRIGSECPLAP